MGARPSSYAQAARQAPQTPIWSSQQEAVFAWFAQPTADAPHLLVRARAGTGKTTTILEGINRAPDATIQLCAFNKRIADTLVTRLTNLRATASTLHALGYRAIRETWGRVDVQARSRGAWLTDQVVNPSMPTGIRRLVTLLHTKAREMCPLEADDAATMEALAIRFEYLPDESWGKWDLTSVVSGAMQVVRFARAHPPTPQTGIDYADMIGLPLLWDLLQPAFDLVVVDEAQDMTAAQLQMCRAIASNRICIVGDDRQAIYGFRGADSGALDALKAQLAAHELPLTVSYRCGQAIAAHAQRLVPDFTAHPSNPPGEVQRATIETMVATIRPGDFLLSRLNAPLVPLTLDLLRRKVRARMAGRDIGQGLQTLLTTLKVSQPATSTRVLLERLDTWERRTVARLLAYGHGDQAGRIHDQADTLRAFAADPQVRCVGDLQREFEWLFTDSSDEDTVLCSSVHKAKGLEAPRVWVLSETFYTRGRTPEETNLEYVAVTRAQTTLVLVEG